VIPPPAAGDGGTSGAADDCGTSGTAEDGGTSGGADDCGTSGTAEDGGTSGGAGLAAAAAALTVLESLVCVGLDRDSDPVDFGVLFPTTNQILALQVNQLGHI